MAASDGTRLNLASELAATAAALQKTVSLRKGKAQESGLLEVLAHVEAGISELSHAVVLLATPVAQPEGGGDA